MEHHRFADIFADVGFQLSDVAAVAGAKAAFPFGTWRRGRIAKPSQAVDRRTRNFRHSSEQGSLEHRLTSEPHCFMPIHPPRSRVPIPDDSWFHRGEFLRQREGFKLTYRREDVPRQGRGLGPCELRTHRNDQPFGQVFLGDRTQVRGRDVSLGLSRFEIPPHSGCRA